MENRDISVLHLSVSSFQAGHQACISPAEGRMQKARAKPPTSEGRMQNAECRMIGQATQSHHKATTRPPQGHILGIDSGVQGHPKATPRPTDSQPIGTPKPPQGYPKATLRLHQGSTKAPPRLHQSHPGAKGEGSPPSAVLLRRTGMGVGKDSSKPRERAPTGLVTRTRRNRLAAMKPTRQHSPPAGTVQVLTIDTAAAPPELADAFLAAHSAGWKHRSNLPCRP